MQIDARERRQHMLRAEELERYHVSESGVVTNRLTGRVLKSCKSSAYPRVTLSVDRVKRQISVHRLVALLYIPNPENKPCVNHKDGNKQNSHVSNLEWVTYSENEVHARQVLGKKTIHSKETKNKLKAVSQGRDMTKAYQASAKKRKGKAALNRKKVMLNGAKVFDSIEEASRQTGISVVSIIKNLKGRSKRPKIGNWTYVISK